MQDNSEVGVCAPLMLYYKTNTIWCAGIQRNMITSRTTYIFNGKEINKIDLPEIIESEDFPNCFMVRAEIIRKNNILFDEKLFLIVYVESVFCYRIRKLGYKIICNPRAKVWHDIPLPEEEKDKIKLLHLQNDAIPYYTARNRIVYHKKYSRWWQFLIFILTFNWLFTLYYLRVILLGSKMSFRDRLKIARSYLNGVWSGLKWKKSC